MIAIQVKFLPPTTTKPMRYKAIAGEHSKIYSAPIEDVDPYVNAAKKLIAEFDFLSCIETEWIGGYLPDNSMVFTSTKWTSKRFTITKQKEV